MDLNELNDNYKKASDSLNKMVDARNNMLECFSAFCDIASQVSISISLDIEMTSLYNITGDRFYEAVEYYFEIPKQKCEAFKTLIIIGFTPKESYDLLKDTFDF